MINTRLQIVLISFFLLSGQPVVLDAAEDQKGPYYRRIVSLSPSITEILYELGVGDQIVGVTRFCKFPKEAQSKESVGGLLDPNFEIIFRLNPDLVICHKGATNHEQTLKAMKLHTLNTVSTSIEGILKSIDVLGNHLNKKEKANTIKKKIQDKIDYLKTKTKELFRPRVLITYWRPLGEGKITQAHIAGNNTFFNELIEMAGGLNAYDGPHSIISPVISAEGILQMNPDVIIEINGALVETGLSVDDALKDWQNLSDLDAYKNRKIFILHKSYIGIPGPRITQTMQDLAQCIHPELDWK